MAYQAPGANSASAAAMAAMPVRKKTAAVKSSQNFDRALFEQERTHDEEVIPSTVVPIGMTRRGIEARSPSQLAIGRGMEGPSTLRAQRGRSRASMAGLAKIYATIRRGNFSIAASALSR